MESVFTLTISRNTREVSSNKNQLHTKGKSTKYPISIKLEHKRAMMKQSAGANDKNIAFKHGG